MARPTHVGVWTPFVTPRMARGPRIGSQVSLAVSAWSFETALAPFDEAEAERGHVELAAVAVDAEAQRAGPRRAARCPSAGPSPSPSQNGPATRRTRFASKRSLPAETGVWIVKTLVALAPRPRRPRAACPLATSSRARSTSRNAEWPSLRCQTRRRDAQCAQRPDAADAQDQLLVEPHLPSADVEDVGDRAVRVVVAGVVRVEQEDRHAAHLEQPDGGVDHPAGQLDRDGQRVADLVQHAQEREAPQVEVGVLVLLVPVRVDRLAEEAPAVEETHADERERHVAGGLHVVAGEHAEAAGVDAERLVEAVLGAEVGDRPRQLAGVVPVEPVVGPVRQVVLERLHHPVVLGDEGGVVQERLPVDARPGAGRPGCGSATRCSARDG